LLRRARNGKTGRREGREKEADGDHKEAKRHAPWQDELFSANYQPKKMEKKIQSVKR
jgi:hypothetical protein